MSELTIRPARTAELTAVGELTLSAYQGDGFTKAGTPYALKLADASARQAEAELLVAVDAEDHLLGTVTIVHPGTPWSEIAVAGQLEFRMLAVAPEARGRGVGEALTRYVLNRAAELGVSTVVMSSSKEMRSAHRLYERLGFHRTPEADWSPVPGVDLITYRLDI
jgi:ribosomal protein S18 acetylase RimI-like enzyme